MHRSRSPNRASLTPAQCLPQLCVVASSACASSGGGGKQVDVVCQQPLQPLLHPTGDPPVLSTPEQTMVPQNRIGLLGNRCIDQGTAGGHAADDACDFTLPSTCRPLGP